MPLITLPDGNTQHYDAPITGLTIAESIGSRLAKDMLAVEVNGQLLDRDTLIEDDATVNIITSNQAAGLEVIRHSCAHLLAQAVKQLFPSAQVTIGPVIEDGFYYDFYYPEGFSPEDLQAIEARMQALAKQDIQVSHQVMARDDAIAFFENLGEQYKADIIRDIPKSEVLTLYTQGDFTDLCRGPHVPSTGHIKAFKLTSLAGAYWRGNSDNAMLQRVYGTAWPDKKQLKTYLFQQEEAKRRDHRLLAKKMGLFHIQQEAPGMVFWHGKGWTLYRLLKQYIHARYEAYGYEEIATPQLVDSSLWQKSGHLDKFGDEMFTVETDARVYALKPMNCPCHVQVFNQGLRSYRDLPLRLAEMGSCHRAEPSGTLHGLMRLRNFIQDDGHIFCMESQIGDEVSAFIQQVKATYADFGFDSFEMRLSTRPEARVGDDSVWDKAEAALEQALNDCQMPWQLFPGEGAFYGPKIEFVLKDCLGRYWQCGTVQLDFAMPKRLEAKYIAEDGSRQVPVMIHRAMLGSLERFLGIVLEQTAGCLPLWLAPVQLVLANVTSETAEYVENIALELKECGFRVSTDLRNEKIGFKIREHAIQRVPFVGVCGARELADGTVTLRTQAGESLGAVNLTVLKQHLQGIN